MDSTYKNPRMVSRGTGAERARYFYCWHGRHWVQAPPKGQTGPTGYGINDKGRAFCYDCAAELDSQRMDETGRAVLYLTRKEDAPKREGERPWRDSSGRTRPTPMYANDWEVSNWPGTLTRNVLSIKRNAHNWRNVERIDVWFVSNGHVWHGVQLGDTQILRCKRTRTEWRLMPHGGCEMHTPRKRKAQ